MVQDLLRLAAPDAEWLKEADFASLEPVSSQFLGDDWQERESDIIWRMKVGGHAIYVYLMLEFQSSHDWTMPVRMMTYTGLLYQALIKQKQVTRKTGLPPVLPIVLYNGSKAWTSSTDVGSLIRHCPAELKSYLPQMRFWLIDENAYQNAPLTAQNMVSALFALEHSRNESDIERVLIHLSQFIENRLQESQALQEWLRRTLLERLKIESPLALVDALHNGDHMLVENMLRWRDSSREEAQRQGQLQGQLQGQRQQFRRLLQIRFALISLPEWAEARIAAADAADLEQWSRLLFSAPTLENVFTQN